MLTWVRDCGLWSSTQCGVLSAIIMRVHAEYNYTCSPSVKLLAFDTRLSENTVEKAISFFVKEGLLRKKNRGYKRSNLYTVLHQQLFNLYREATGNRNQVDTLPDEILLHEICEYLLENNQNIMREAQREFLKAGVVLLARRLGSGSAAQTFSSRFEANEAEEIAAFKTSEEPGLHFLEPWQRWVDSHPELIG